MKIVIKMKRNELERIKEPIDRIDVMREDDFREYILECFQTEVKGIIASCDARTISRKM